MARLTVTKYIELMKHALGKVPDSRHSLIDTFNQAGRCLFHVAEQSPWGHQWTWLAKDNVDFELPGGSVEQVALPVDFGTLISLHATGTILGRVQTVPLSRLNSLRRSTVLAGNGVYVSFDVGQTQPSGDSDPIKVAAFWPPQASALTGLKLAYIRTWREMGTADGERIPDIPVEYDRLLMLMSRAYAIHLEDQAQAAEDPLVVNEINRLVAHDGMRQSALGVPSHSVRNRARRRPDSFYGQWTPT